MTTITKSKPNPEIQRLKYEIEREWNELRKKQDEVRDVLGEIEMIEIGIEDLEQELADEIGVELKNLRESENREI